MKPCGTCDHLLPSEKVCDQGKTPIDGECLAYVADASLVNPYDPITHPVKWAEWEALEKGRHGGDE